MEAYGGMEV